MSQQNKPVPGSTGYFYSYGNNQLGAEKVFTERIMWQERIYPSMGVGPTYDFWDNDMSNFGTTNTKGNAVYSAGDALRELRYTGVNESLFALDFVSDAWRDFCDEIRRFRLQGILSQQGPYYDFSVFKGWRSSSTRYHEYMTEILYPAFASSFVSDRFYDNQIKDFDSFLKVFTRFFNAVIQDVGPITFSGFLESTNSSPLDSGLAIEISTDPHDDDFNKQAKFFYDINFPLIYKIASQYGFTIDKNAPWRFVANLESDVMAEYAYGIPMTERGIAFQQFDECGEPILGGDPNYLEPYGYSQVPGLDHIIRHAPGYLRYQNANNVGSLLVEDVFKGAFIETWNTDIDLLLLYLIDFYNRTVLMKPYYSEKTPIDSLCEDVQDILYQRETTSLEEVGGLYGNRWKLKTFYLARTSERKFGESISKKKRDIQNILSVYSHMPGGRQERYLKTLKYVQEYFVGPTKASPLKILKSNLR